MPSTVVVDRDGDGIFDAGSDVIDGFRVPGAGQGVPATGPVALVVLGVLLLAGGAWIVAHRRRATGALP